MSTITNGTVEFERVLRPADFESKRVKVTLSFAVGDDEDPAAATARVGDMAHAEIFRMLAKKEQAVSAVVKPPKVEPPREVAQENPTTNPDAATADQSIKTATPATTTSDPPVVVEPVAPSTAPIGDASPSDIVEVANPTDAELQAACQRARSRGCTPDQLKELIATMVPQPGMRVVHITDPAGRAAALAKIDALQAGAATTGDY